MEKRWVGSVFIILSLVLLVFAVGYATNSYTSYGIFDKIFDNKELTSTTRIESVEVLNTAELPRCAVVKVLNRGATSYSGSLPFAEPESGTTLNSYISGTPGYYNKYNYYNLLNVPADSGVEACGFLNQLSSAEWECVEAFRGERDHRGIAGYVRDCRETYFASDVPPLRISHALCCRFD